MEATVGWWNEQLWGSDGKVAAEGKGSRGDGKAQKQPREQAAEQELVVQVARKDIKRGRKERKGLQLNRTDVRGIGCRGGMKMQRLNQEELGAKELGCGADLTRATKPDILCIVYGEMSSYDVLRPADLM